MNKVLYTYKWTNEWNKGLDNPKAVTILRKSVEQANRWYETEIWCDEEKGYDIIKNLDIPFTRIRTTKELNQYQSTNWGITKLITIKNQFEPHIHIDMDTILLKELKFDTSKDIIWGNVQASLLYGKGHYLAFKHIYEAYMKIAERFEPKLLEEDFFDFAHVPNNSLLIINNPRFIQKTIIELQERIKPYYKTELGPLNSFMEQFLFGNLCKWNGANGAYSHTNHDGRLDYMPRIGEYQIDEYNKDLILSGEIPFSDFEENGWIHFQGLNEYSESEIKQILDNIK